MALYDSVKDGVPLADLYQALMNAFEQLDDPESALQALEHALAAGSRRGLNSMPTRRIYYTSWASSKALARTWKKLWASGLRTPDCTIAWAGR